MGTPSPRGGSCHCRKGRRREAVLPAHRGVTTLRQRTRITARQLEVRMLVIDEIHSTLAGTFREQRIVLNAIRFLANDLRKTIQRSFSCWPASPRSYRC